MQQYTERRLSTASDYDFLISAISAAPACLHQVYLDAILYTSLNQFGSLQMCGF